jgi:RNA polymerase sigma-70 factor (ECF subfamily)
MSSDATPVLDSLLRQHHWLRRLASSLVVDAARADDLVQRALLAALDAPPATADHPRAWLATVVRRLVRRDRLDEQGRVDLEQRSIRRDLEPATDEVVARAALQHEISAAVLALAEPYRTALLLRFFEDRPPRAIAKATRVPVETVRTRVKRGLELLRAELVERRAQRAQRSGDASGTGEWAVALVGLLDRSARRTVRRLVLAKSSAATAAVASGVSVVGVLGVLGMSMKLQLAAAVVVVAAGTFTVVKLCEPERLPPRSAAADSAHARDALAAASSADATPHVPAASATRAPDAAPKPASAPTAAKPVGSFALEGIVKNQRGDAVADAFVLLDANPHDGATEELDQLCGDVSALAAKTGELAADSTLRIVRTTDGRFRFDALARGATVAIAAVHPVEGIAPATGVKLGADGPDAPLELTLVPGVVFVGAVVDEQGVPLANAHVDVFRFEGDEHSSTTSSLSGATTDASGRYRTAPFPYRSFGLTATAPGFVTCEFGHVVVPEGVRDQAADFRLVRSTTWRGKVVAVDGAPARLARVQGELVLADTYDDPRGKANSFRWAQGRGTLLRDEDRWEITPSDARARFVGLWCGEKLLGAVELGEADHSPDLVVDLAQARSAPKSGVLLVDVVAARDDAPIRDFELSWQRDPLEELQSKGGYEKRKFAAADGRASVEELAVGRYHVVVAAEGFAARVVDVAVASPPVATRVALPDVGRERLAGRVDDELGHPVGGVRVYLLDPDGKPPLAWAACGRRTDDAGRFRFDALQPGDYVLAVESPDGLAPTERPVTVKRRSDAESAPAADPDAVDVAVTLASGVEVRVEPVGRDVHVEGPFTFRIRDERGIAVHDGHRGDCTTTVSGSGGIPFRLAPGSYLVEVHCPHFVTGVARFVAANDARVTVEMVPLDGAATDR